MYLTCQLLFLSFSCSTFYQRRYRFTQIVADAQIKTPGGKTYDVLFVGTGKPNVLFNQFWRTRANIDSRVTWAYTSIMLIKCAYKIEEHRWPNCEYHLTVAQPFVQYLFVDGTFALCCAEPSYIFRRRCLDESEAYCRC